VGKLPQRKNKRRFGERAKAGKAFGRRALHGRIDLELEKAQPGELDIIKREDYPLTATLLN
jgi:hypothetical protein